MVLLKKINRSRLGKSFKSKTDISGSGAALGSCRRKMQEEDCSHILEVFKRSDVRYFLYNGGNDSMHTAHSVEKLAALQDTNYS